MKQKVYVVVESGWNGSCYSAESVSVFSNYEDAKKCEAELNARFKANISTFIEEAEIDSYFDE